MDIQNAEKFTEKFSKDFQALLTPDNSFYLNTKGETSSDLTINVPQYLTEIAGPSDVTSNAALDVVEYGEDNTTVTQKRFKTKAYQIVDYKEFFTAQDQRQNCMEAMKAFIDTRVGNFAAYKFSPATTTLKSTGTVTRTTEVVGSNATVKTFVKADFIAIKKAMAKTNLMGKWYALISPEVLGDLFAIDDFVKADSLGIQQSRLLNGEFADILGIRFFLRSPSSGANVSYKAVGSPAVITKQDIYGVVGAADTIGNTNVGGIIVWNEAALYSNKGLTKFYTNAADAIYQSDVLSMQHTYGVEPIKKSAVGVIFMAEGL